MDGYLAHGHSPLMSHPTIMKYSRFIDIYDGNNVPPFCVIIDVDSKTGGAQCVPVQKLENYFDTLTIEEIHSKLADILARKDNKVMNKNLAISAAFEIISKMNQKSLGQNVGLFSKLHNRKKKRYSSSSSSPPLNSVTDVDIPNFML